MSGDWGQSALVAVHGAAHKTRIAHYVEPTLMIDIRDAPYIARKTFLNQWSPILKYYGMGIESVSSDVNNQNYGDSNGIWRIFHNHDPYVFLHFNDRVLDKSQCDDWVVFRFGYSCSWLSVMKREKRSLVAKIEAVFFASGCLCCGPAVACRRLYLFQEVSISSLFEVVENALRTTGAVVTFGLLADIKQIHTAKIQALKILIRNLEIQFVVGLYPEPNTEKIMGFISLNYSNYFPPLSVECHALEVELVLSGGRPVFFQT